MQTGITPLQVLLTGDRSDEIAPWCALNLRWLGDGVRLASLRFGRGRARLAPIAIGDVHDEVRPQPVTAPETVLEAGAFAGDEDILLVGGRWTMRADWRSVIARATAQRPLESATGRLLVPAEDRARAPVDMMPGLIAGAVREWNFSAAMHGVVCDRLPPDCLWIDRSAHRRFFAALNGAGSLAEAVAHFYAVPAAKSHAYLSDLIATQRAGWPAAVGF